MKTDAQIQKDVIDELDWDPAVRSAHIGVIVHDGVVTLTGHLQTYAEKLAAERAAQRVKGVNGVAVELDVRIHPEQARTDTDIAAAIHRTLEWSVHVPDGRIQVQVERGWVSLSGSVEWDYQRKAAERAVRELAGVVGITDLIAVKPRISPIDIQHNIESALARHAEREARHMQVIVEGSRVTLRGTVQSWAERKAAQGAAWSAPGVTSVTNELLLAS